MKKLLRLNIILFILFLIAGSCKEENIIEEEDKSVNVTSKLIYDNINGKDIVIIGNPASNFIVSFEQKLTNGEIPNLSVVNGQLPVLMKDDNDNFYDIFGRIVEGEKRGEILQPILSYQSYWFAIAAFFPGIEIYERGGEDVELDLRTNPDWSIPTSNVFIGTAFDAIPTIDDPNFKLINNDGPNIDPSLIPKADDLIIGIMEGGEPIAYPHNILNWHEVLNQVIEDYFITISFCPLTGTAIGWKGDNSFGVSGLLYNSNLIAYDRSTESLWSQMLASSVKGDLRDEKLNVFSLTETTWGTWSTMYPDTKLLTTDTGFSRDYDQTPYSGYKENNDLIYYPLDYNDARLPNKERVHAVIINNEAKVYTFDDF